MLDPATGGPVASIVPSGTPDVEQHSGELAPDGSRFVVYRDRASRLWDVESTREIARIEGGKESIVFSTDGLRFTGPGAIFSPDSRRLAVLADETSAVAVCDSANGRRLFEAAYKGFLAGLAFSPDGRLMATISGDDSAIQIWDSQTGRLVRPSPIFPSFWQTRHSAATADGWPSWAASATMPFGCGTWSREGPPTILRAGNQGTQHRGALTFTPNGRLISAGPGPTVKIWNLETGAELLRFRGATGPLAVSPDGRAVAFAGESGVLRIWDSQPIAEDKLLDEVAARKVEELYRQHYLRTGVLAAVSADGTLREPLRGLVRALIDRHAEDIEGFIRSVRSILRTEDATAVALENARARTEAANNYYKEAAIPELLTTLGIARYRVGDALRRHRGL